MLAPSEVVIVANKFKYSPYDVLIVLFPKTVIISGEKMTPLL